MILCPFKLANPHHFIDYEDTISVATDYAQCEKEKCAWWIKYIDKENKEKSCCAIKSIAENISET